MDLLPDVMVAPTGARRMKREHSALPVTIAEIVKTAAACHAAGAEGLHAHVRDAEGKHTLDAGLYRELLAEMARAVPEMRVQITTEAAGIYSPEEQVRVVREVCPRGVSAALRELTAGDDIGLARDFYHWALGEGIVVQHILYGVDDVARLAELVKGGVVPSGGLAVLFVIGSYTGGSGDGDGLASFLGNMDVLGSDVEWAACAFGRDEIRVLAEAWDWGGKCRIGFENNLLRENGHIAVSNEERVHALIEEIK
ncbi:MAG: 3-keto-5-aminohexanoate cleavage protein [Alphaproteobacteria bacterium]|nr:3-keto-5-aminohexanoate cleavage protein [Alphaproteobacteria bacterium]MDA7983327.1 3-keto-5-aminohexanoate cleavage protein [Alphaproteobacteria bacterium]MDA7988869.1 3-keto-5-aminohexanoate cleavage protein [Alphaproteobacteria bacterium]MDA8009235.1 3-keto-5-aminohexanoate cleavage protein [Alphaproteobacteria bacterium]